MSESAPCAWSYLFTHVDLWVEDGVARRTVAVLSIDNMTSVVGLEIPITASERLKSCQDDDRAAMQPRPRVPDIPGEVDIHAH